MHRSQARPVTPSLHLQLPVKSSHSRLSEASAQSHFVHPETRKNLLKPPFKQKTPVDTDQLRTGSRSVRSGTGRISRQSHSACKRIGQWRGCIVQCRLCRTDRAGSPSDWRHPHSKTACRGRTPLQTCCWGNGDIFRWWTRMSPDRTSWCCRSIGTVCSSRLQKPQFQFFNKQYFKALCHFYITRFAK